jgi:hypothetical protein
MDIRLEKNCADRLPRRRTTLPAQRRIALVSDGCARGGAFRSLPITRANGAESGPFETE